MLMNNDENDNNANILKKSKINVKPRLYKHDQDKLDVLFKKYKKLMFSYKSLVEFKEPVLFLIKRNGNVEFYENVKKSVFKFKDDDDVEKEINLDPRFLLKFDYGNKIFKGYICYEDEAFPYPQKPIIYAEMFKLAIDKVIHDFRKWKEKEIKATAELFWKVGLAVALIIISIAVYKTLAPSRPDQVIEQVYMNMSNIVKSNLTRVG